MASSCINRVFLSVIVCISLFPVGHTQVVTDGSLGQAAALVGPNFKVTDTLGRTVGDNLFHSFMELNLQKGESVVFTGPKNIQNILGRVTGGETSQIDGLIQSEIKGANLYLLNPEGFVFGKNAKVDVDGAFSIHATDKIIMDEEGVFDALNPDQSVFVSAPPEAYGFLEENPRGKIKMDSTKLRIEGGNRSLNLVGGEIEITEKSSITLHNGASFGQYSNFINHKDTKIITKSKKKDQTGAGGIEMIADEINLVGVDITSETWNFDANDIVVKSNNTYFEKGIVKVSSRGRGGVAGVSFIKNKKDEISTIKSGKNTSIISEVRSQGNGSTIDIDHDEMLLGLMKIKSLNYGEGLAGDIKIKGKNLKMSGDLISKTTSEKNGGNIVVEVGNITINQGKILSQTVSQKVESSKGGDIYVKCKSLSLFKAAAILTETIGVSNAGNIFINSEEVDIQGVNAPVNIWIWPTDRPTFGGIGSVTHKRGGELLGGNAGDVTLRVKNIKLSKSGVVFVVTKGSGDAGTLNLEANKLEIIGSDNFYKTGGDIWNLVGDIDNEMYDSQITGQVWDDLALGLWKQSSGRGGDLNISVDELYMSQKGRIRLESWGEGSAGTLKLNAGKIRMSKISSIEAYADKTGNAGTVNINSNDIELDGSRIVAFTKGIGLPGEININPLDNEMSSVFKLMNDSGLSTSLNRGSGVGGDLNVNMDNLIIVKSKIKSEAGLGAEGVAGNVNINTGSFKVFGDSKLVNSELSTTTKGRAHGGGISINSDDVDLSRIEIISESKSKKLTVPGGDSGTIEISSNNINLAHGVSISAETHGRGKAGAIDLKSDTIHMEGGETKLDMVLLSGNTTLRDEKGTAGDVVGGVGGAINIRADSINLGRNVILSSETLGNGGAGELSIESNNLVLTDGVVLSVSSGFEVDSRYSNRNAYITGNGGDLKIKTEKLIMSDGSKISAASSGVGHGGVIMLNANLIDIESGAVVESHAYGRGDAGSIEVDAVELKLNGGQLASGSESEGSAGRIDLSLAKGLMLGKSALVSVSSTMAEGGDITINTDGEVRLTNSELTASAALDGGSVRLLGAGNVLLTDSEISAEAGQDGGNIEVRSSDTLVLQRSGLSANAIHGKGGYISIAAEGYLPSLESSVTASSEFGLVGSVEIDTPETNVGSGLIVLSDGLMATDAKITERCALRLQGDVSSFFLNGYGGLPTSASENYVPAIIVNTEED